MKIAIGISLSQVTSVVLTWVLGILYLAKFGKKITASNEGASVWWARGAVCRVVSDNGCGAESRSQPSTRVSFSRKSVRGGTAAAAARRVPRCCPPGMQHTATTPSTSVGF
jgi:hypothetical protein